MPILQKKRATPVLKSLRKNLNKNGHIDALSLTSVRIASITDTEVQAAAKEMEALRLSLEKL